MREVVERISSVLKAPAGELVDSYLLCSNNGDVNMIGRCKKQNGGKGLEIRYLKGMPNVNGDFIVFFEERSASGAHGKFVNRGTPAEYSDKVWAMYDPILREVGQ